MSLVPRDPTGRVPPGQIVTTKFPVMTAGSPRVTPAADWTLTLALETADGAVTELGRWDMAAFRALPQTEITVDIHCVTRWSKLDTRWRGVLVDDLFAAVGDALPPLEAAPVDAPEAVDGERDPAALPLAYVEARSDGDFSANLRRADLAGEGALIALDHDAGDGLKPLAEAHGGPARLVIPKLYFWKSAKWLRRLTVSPFDRKGFWERLGYHNYGDPWREQRYRGQGAEDWRRTLDPELSRQIRRERLGR